LEKGYEATNIRDICKEVEIKPSSLYFYYKSKEELFFSIYDEIWSEEIKYIANLKELKQDISPKKKLYYLFKKTMKYYSQDIVKQKFLLRYHLFSPGETVAVIQQKYMFWKNKENEIILGIINQCLEEKILDDSQHPNKYLQRYRMFKSSQVTDMIISNIKISNQEIEKCWVEFWNCIISNEL
jgi:AcrR family transcriptional regulator